MSVAQSLPKVGPGAGEILPFFMQECPICGRENRIVVLGVYQHPEKGPQNYPDIGYSFCNCKNVFYTRFENLAPGAKREEADPVERMRLMFETMYESQMASLVLPDPFFCEWGNDPYTTFLHWNPRVHMIIWDKEQFEDEMREIGFEIVRSDRQFDVNKPEVQQTFEIVVRKPVEGVK